CGNKFSSSLCNADLKVNGGRIEILKKYRLRCLKCNENATFDQEESLNKFLEQRFKQKLIYKVYKKKFEEYDEYEKDSARELKGHRQELCEKCRLHGKHCGEL
ncbi:3566_t:CDS:1, partial [Acaulospora colombiana]